MISTRFQTFERATTLRNNSLRLHAPERLDDRIALTVDVSPLGDPVAVNQIEDLPPELGSYFRWNSDFQLAEHGTEAPSDAFGVSFEELIGFDHTSSIGRAKDGSFIASRVASQTLTAQAYDASGNTVGQLIEIPGVRTHDSAKSTSTSVVAWSNASNQVFAQTFDANGTPHFEQPLELGTGAVPAVAISEDGSFVIAWESYDQFKQGIVGQKFDSNGQPLGPQLQLNNTFEPGTEEYSPDVAIDGDGNFIVAWENFVPEMGMILPIGLQRFDSSSTTVGQTMAFDADATQAQVEMDESGNFVVAWQSTGAGYNLQVFSTDLEPDQSSIVNIDSNSFNFNFMLNERGNFVIITEDLTSQVRIQEYETSLVPTEPFNGANATENDDHVQVVIGASSYTMTTNGGEPVTVSIADTPRLELEGHDGRDTLVIVGSSLDEEVFANGDTSEVTVRSQLYELIATGFERVTVNGGGGTDSAELYGSSDIRKRDRLFGYPSDVHPTVMHAGVTNNNLVNADFVFEMQDFLRVDSFGRGGWDYATLFGTDGNDHFYRFSDYEVLVGNGMIQKTKDFARVDAYGRNGNDSSHLTDSVGDDKYFSFPDFSVLLLGEAGKDRLKVKGFEHMHVNSRQGGQDTAYLSRMKSTDALFAIPEVVWMTRASRFETVLGFHSFIASPDEDETPFLSVFEDVENLLVTGTWVNLV